MMLTVVLAMTIPRLMGYKVYSVMSPSMAPTIPTGSLIFVKPTNFEGIAKGDIATFQSVNNPDNRFTHRVVDILTSERRFVTQGDANAGPDPDTASPANLIGKVVYSVPIAGFPALLLDNHIWAYAIFGVLLIWLVIEIELVRLSLATKTLKKKSTQ